MLQKDLRNFTDYIYVYKYGKKEDGLKTLQWFNK